MAPSAIQDITSGSEHIALRPSGNMLRPLSIYPVLLQEPWVNLYVSVVCKLVICHQLQCPTFKLIQHVANRTYVTESDKMYLLTHFVTFELVSCD